MDDFPRPRSDRLRQRKDVVLAGVPVCMVYHTTKSQNFLQEQRYNSPYLHDITYFNNGSSICHSVKVSDCEMNIPACVHSGFCFPYLVPEAGLDLRMPG